MRADPGSVLSLMAAFARITPWIDPHITHATPVLTQVSYLCVCVCVYVFGRGTEMLKKEREAVNREEGSGRS